MNIKNCSMAVKKPLIESIISVIFKQIRIRFSVQIALFITARLSNSALSLLFSISLVSMAVDVIERSSSLDIQMTVYGLYLKRHLLKL